MPVLIHTADPLAFFQPLDESNERWEDLRDHPDWYFGEPEFPDHDTLLAQRNYIIERHPNTTFIGAHVGNYPENLAYVDTAERIGETGRYPPEEVRAFFLKPQDRVLFGTDLVLGWELLEKRAPKNVAECMRFYDAHWRFFEMDARQTEYPSFPFQGRWKVDAINLSDEVLEKLFGRNAQRLIPGLQE